MTLEGYEQNSVAVCPICKQEKIDDGFKRCFSCRKHLNMLSKRSYAKISKLNRERGLCSCGNPRKDSLLSCDECLKAGCDYVRKNPHSTWASKTISSHKRKQYVVNIKRGELTELAQQVTSCKYCGVELDWGYGHKNGVSTHNSPSLDRVNNGNELSLETVQIICVQCNTRKQRDTEEEFVAYCKRIVENFGSTIISDI